MTKRRKVILAGGTLLLLAALAAVGVVLYHVGWLDQCLGRTGPTPGARPVGVIDLNTASPGELDKLPGIGPAIARAIVTRRQQRPFRDFRELVDLFPSNLNLINLDHLLESRQVSIGDTVIPGVEEAVELNTARWEALAALPEINPTAATRIIGRRRARPFRSLDELSEIITAAKLDRLRRGGRLMVRPLQRGTEEEGGASRGVHGDDNLAPDDGQVERVPFSAKPEATDQININTATLTKLTELRGIGRYYAQKIIEHRDAVPFRDVMELRGLIKDQNVFRMLLTDRRAIAIMPNDDNSGYADAGQLDLNQATREELVNVPGIGIIIAGRILERRTERPFNDLEELRGLMLPRPFKTIMRSGLLTVGGAESRGRAQVNLNTASANELCTLPHITPGLAEKIIRMRQVRPLTRINDLNRLMDRDQVWDISRSRRATVVAAAPGPASDPDGSATRFSGLLLVIAGLGVILAVVLLVPALRERPLAVAERLLSRVSLRSKFTLAALAAGLAAAAAVWFFFEATVIADLERQFNQECEVRNRAVRFRWNELQGVAFEQNLIAVSSYATGLRQLQAYAGEGNEPAVDLSSPLVPFACAAAAGRAGGVEIIYLHRPSTDLELEPRLFLSAGVDQSHRDPIRDVGIKQIHDENGTEIGREKLEAVSGIFSFAVDDTASPAVYLYSGARYITSQGQIGTLLRVTDSVLDDLARELGEELALTVDGRLVATSIFRGEPMLTLPELDAWAFRSLARALTSGNTRRLSPETIRHLSGTISRPVALSPAALGRKLNRELAPGIAGGPDLSRIVPRVRVWWPVRAEDGSIPMPAMTDTEGVLGLFFPDHRLTFPSIVSLVTAAFPPRTAPTLELLDEVFPGADTKWTGIPVRERLLVPLNLRIAEPTEVRDLVTALGMRDPDRISRELERFRGLAAPSLTAADLDILPGTTPPERELLAGFLYQQDPALSIEVRQVMAAVRADEPLQLDGREYLPTAAVRTDNGLELLVFNPHDQLLDQVAHLRWIGLASIALVLILTWAVLQLVGTTILRPFRRFQAAMASLEIGELGVRLPVVGRDEFREVADSFNQMAGSVQARERLERSFRRYVPATVVQAALDPDQSGILTVHRRECSILFAAVHGFNQAVKDTGPAAAVDLLNHYLAIFVEVISAEGGTVDKFLGDALLAVFGAPLLLPEHADRAVAAAVGIQERIHALNCRRGAAGQPILLVGIGIATGQLIAGNLGNEQRTDWTIIGADVNLAARIGTDAWPYKILVSDPTAARLKLEIPRKAYSPTRLKGYAEPVRLHGILWYRGRSRPVLTGDDPAVWWQRAGEVMTGPFTAAELIDQPGFSAAAEVSTDRERWSLWHRAARGFPVWSIETATGAKGPLTFDELVAQPKLTSATRVRLLGDTGWRPLEYFSR